MSKGLVRACGRRLQLFHPRQPQQNATHQPSIYRLESAERLAAASFRAALRGLQNFRASLEEQKQLQERRNEATAAALYQSADTSF